VIKEFKNNAVRDFGNVYQSMLSQIKKRYEKDPVQAGELAISFIEYVLTGDISSDDDIIEGFVEGYKATTKKSQDKYDAKVAATKDALKPIADMYNQGMTQADIARVLGVQPPAISKKMNTIRTQFPELLESEGKLKKVSEISGNIGNISKVSENVGKFPKNLESVEEVSENFGNIGKEEESLETFPSFQSFHNNNNYNNNKNNNNNEEVSISPGGDLAAPPKRRFDF
jgi:predicted transcriptional regulator